MKAIYALILTVLFIFSWSISLWFMLLTPVFATILAFLVDGKSS